MKYIEELIEHINEWGCMCLLHKDENNNIARLQICVGSEADLRALVEMCGASITDDDDEILIAKAQIEFQIVHDKQ